MARRQGWPVCLRAHGSFLTVVNSNRLLVTRALSLSVASAFNLNEVSTSSQGSGGEWESFICSLDSDFVGPLYELFIDRSISLLNYCFFL